MWRQRILELAKSDYPKLLPILGLAFYIAFIPHQSYPYAIHVDEWLHLAYSEAMLKAGDAVFINPFYGQSTIGLSVNLEASFHLFWGVFQQISGLSWMTIFRYFPGIIFIFVVLASYIMARREGFGLLAAFFTCLIPTTVGIMGPAFLVPVALGLLFTPLLVFLAFNYRTIRSYLLVFIFTCLLLAIHAPSAICPIIVLAPYILLNLKGDFKHSLGLTLALLLPFLIIFPWIFNLLISTAQGLFISRAPTEYVQLPQVVRDYGYLPLFFCLLGTFTLAVKGGKKHYGLVLGLLALLLMLVSFFTFERGVPIMYERGLMFMMLMTGIIAGAGLLALKELKLPDRLTNRLKVPLVTKNVGVFLCLAAIGLTLALTVPQRLDTGYYHMIDEQDYQAFVWIRDNVSEDYNRAIVDPWKATAFTALTGKYVYTRIHAYPKDTDEEAYAFLKQGSTDTTFLTEKGISIIYTRVYNGVQDLNTEYGSSNPDLVQIADNIYLLKERGQ